MMFDWLIALTVQDLNSNLTIEEVTAYYQQFLIPTDYMRFTGLFFYTNLIEFPCVFIFIFNLNLVYFLIFILVFIGYWKLRDISSFHPRYLRNSTITSKRMRRKLSKLIRFIVIVLIVVISLLVSAFFFSSSITICPSSIIPIWDELKQISKLGFFNIFYLGLTKALFFQFSDVYHSPYAVFVFLLQIICILIIFCGGIALYHRNLFYFFFLLILISLGLFQFRITDQSILAIWFSNIFVSLVFNGVLKILLQSRFFIKLLYGWGRQPISEKCYLAYCTQSSYFFVGSCIQFVAVGCLSVWVGVSDNIAIMHNFAESDPIILIFFFLFFVGFFLQSSFFDPKVLANLFLESPSWLSCLVVFSQLASSNYMLMMICSLVSLSPYIKVLATCFLLICLGHIILILKKGFVGVFNFNVQISYMLVGMFVFLSLPAIFSTQMAVNNFNLSCSTLLLSGVCWVMILVFLILKTTVEWAVHRRDEICDIDHNLKTVGGLFFFSRFKYIFLPLFILFIIAGFLFTVHFIYFEFPAGFTGTGVGGDLILFLVKSIFSLLCFWFGYIFLHLVLTLFFQEPDSSFFETPRIFKQFYFTTCKNIPTYQILIYFLLVVLFILFIFCPTTPVVIISSASIF